VTDLRTLQASYDVVDEFIRAGREYSIVASKEELIRIRELLDVMIKEAKSVNAT